jgi:hypothetical protein
MVGADSTAGVGMTLGGKEAVAKGLDSKESCWSPLQAHSSTARQSISDNLNSTPIPGDILIAAPSQFCPWSVPELSTRVVSCERAYMPYVTAQSWSRHVTPDGPLALSGVSDTNCSSLAAAFRSAVSVALLSAANEMTSGTLKAVPRDAFRPSANSSNLPP